MLEEEEEEEGVSRAVALYSAIRGRSGLLDRRA